MEYIFSFAIGGSVVSGIKFLSDKVPPKYVAILGALPIGLLSSLYIKKIKFLEHYLENYAMITLLLVLTAILYDFLLIRGISRMKSFIISISFLVILLVLKTVLIKEGFLTT